LYAQATNLVIQSLLNALESMIAQQEQFLTPSTSYVLLVAITKPSHLEKHAFPFVLKGHMLTNRPKLA
jgi:hypothetical protein